MKENGEDINPPGKKEQQSAASTLYPASEDIYNQSEKLEDADPENTTALKQENDSDDAGSANEKNFVKDLSGSDLDIPGSELDDDDEITGSEDEENNGYSIGGDNHNNLEEEKGE